MKQKLVICKTCGTQIAKSAKRCPNCGAKQARAGKTVGIILAVLIIIGIAAAIGGGDSQPQKVTEDNTAASTASTPDSDSQTGFDSQPEIFGQGDQVALHDIVVTLVNVSENNGGNYMTPSDGKVFLVCEFEIENNSERDIAVSSMLSFEAYVDDYSAGINLSAMLSTDKPQLDGTVAAGKKMNGVIGYEVDPDWKEIEIRFTPDFWSGEEIVFQTSNV